MYISTNLRKQTLKKKKVYFLVQAQSLS